MNAIWLSTCIWHRLFPHLWRGFRRCENLLVARAYMSLLSLYFSIWALQIILPADNFKPSVLNWSFFCWYIRLCWKDCEEKAYLKWKTENVAYCFPQECYADCCKKCSLSNGAHCSDGPCCNTSCLVSGAAVSRGLLSWPWKSCAASYSSKHVLCRMKRNSLCRVRWLFQTIMWLLTHT